MTLHIPDFHKDRSGWTQQCFCKEVLIKGDARTRQPALENLIHKDRGQPRAERHVQCACVLPPNPQKPSIPGYVPPPPLTRRHGLLHPRWLLPRKCALDVPSRPSEYVPWRGRPPPTNFASVHVRNCRYLE